MAPFGNRGLDLLDGDRPRFKTQRRRQLWRWSRLIEMALDQGHSFLREGAMVTLGLGFQALVQSVREIPDDDRCHGRKRYHYDCILSTRGDELSAEYHGLEQKT